MPPLHPLESRLAALWPPPAWSDLTVLLAVSGGADSVAMLRAMDALKVDGPGRLVAAHVNHQLRGPQSAADEAFVVDLCHRLDMPCEVLRAEADKLAADRTDGLESAARKARYGLLQETAARLGARYVATAHTADDQAETILHRVIRGTGVAGLAGMARARPFGPAATLIRPLLGVRRVELLEYLDALGQPFRCDSSNEDLRFTRNRIRHQLFPQLAREFNSGVVEAVLRLGSLAGEVQAVVERIVEELAGKCVLRPNSELVEISLVPLATQPRYVVRELLIAAWRRQGWPLQAMGFVQWDLLADIVLTSRDDPRHAPRKQMFPGRILAERLPDRLRLSRVPARKVG